MLPSVINNPHSSKELYEYNLLTFIYNSYIMVEKLSSYFKMKQKREKILILRIESDFSANRIMG